MANGFNRFNRFDINFKYFQCSANRVETEGKIDALATRGSDEIFVKLSMRFSMYTVHCVRVYLQRSAVWPATAVGGCPSCEFTSFRLMAPVRIVFCERFSTFLKIEEDVGTVGRTFG